VLSSCFETIKTLLLILMDGWLGAQLMSNAQHAKEGSMVRGNPNLPIAPTPTYLSGNNPKYWI
jgi:hypothetical protein